MALTRGVPRVRPDVPKPLAEFVGVGRRYVRSVDIARDSSDPTALDGYVLTPSVRDAARRLLPALRPGSTQRAFRITGPYGSGKSAFGLLLARLASERSDGHTEGGAAEALLAGGGIEVPPDLPDYVPLVVVGKRASLQETLLAAIADSAARAGRRGAVIARRASTLAADRAAGARDDDAILTVLADLARRPGPGVGKGVLLIIDEVGRFLEHAALNPRSDDPSFVQRLAEAAGGASEAPIAVVALTHHRFADYAAGLGERAEAEWTRSAERYEEIAFHGSAEQTLFFLGQAIEARAALDRAVVSVARSLYREASEVGAFTTQPGELADLAPRLFPLHPASVACLARLSARFGQHERSVVGFLQSFEPHGFRRFLEDTTTGAGAWYRIPDLFDYLRSQGPGRPGRGDDERRRTLALDAVAAAADMPATDLAVLKCVALLSLLEPVRGLRTDARTVAWALDLDRDGASAALGRLRDRGLLHHRTHRDDYCLWSGTSVDLGAWMAEARTRVPASTRLGVEALGRARPMVAHRHYHRTGTLRAFEILAWDGDRPVPTASGAEVDGAIVLVPVHPGETIPEIVGRHAAAFGSVSPLTLFCLRRVSPADLASAHEYRMWRWIEANCAELRVDDLARREVAGRVAAAGAATAASLRPFDGDERGDVWIHDGAMVPVATRAALSALLSAACDRAFAAAPTLRNELVNRSRLSSAAASARMRLLEAMVAGAGLSRLGLTGTPPEMAVYMSLLEAPGLHRVLADGGHGFAPPGEDDPLRWGPAWREVEAAIEGSTTPRPVPELLARLGAPPYGLRSGPALVLVAAVMLHHRHDVALAERGTFQPELTGAHLMRLAKTPANFALRHVGRHPGRRALLEALAASDAPWPGDAHPEPTVKSLVAALYRWWGRLPEYARGTSSIGPVAKAVRSVLEKGREPVDLILDALPRACGVVPGPDGAHDGSAYAEALSAALREIDDAPRIVRSRAVDAMLDAFGAGSAETLRTQVEADYGPHRYQLADPRMRTLVDRITARDVDVERWLDGVAGALCGRRPDAWRDETVDRFAFEVRAMAQSLARWLATMRAAGFGTAPLVAVHVTATDGRERALMVRPGAPARGVAARLAAVRRALGDGPEGAEALAHLLAERIDELGKTDA